MPTPTPEQVRQHRACLGLDTPAAVVEYRMTHGLTQVGLARWLLVTPDAVQSWELGRRHMPASTQLLARALAIRRVRQALRLAGLWSGQ